MAANTIDTAFIEQFEADVHIAYQRQGSRLRNTVRTKNNVANKTTFQKVAKGAASQKSRGGDVTPMNLAHTNVNVTLQDWYASEYIDDLDELRINIDERMVAASSGAWALGRKTDSLITTAMDTTTSTMAHGSAGLNKAKVTEAFETFGNNDVPEDSQRYWVVGYQQWTDLMDLSEFANLDFIGSDGPWPSGVTAKSWLGFNFFAFSGLDLAATTRKTFAYHQSSMGHAIGADVELDVTWQGQKQAHLFVNKMQMNAVLIDANGIIEVSCTES
jgi:hypothetical protein